MKERNGEHPFGDAGQLIFLCIFLVIWVVDSFFLHKTTFLSKHVPLYIRLVIMALSLITAAYLFKSGHVVVRHGSRPSGVVSTGAFRYVRHPLYLASILFYIGLVVSTASLFSLLLLMMIFIFYNHIANYEERLLLRKFGENYETYRKKTGRWVPRIARRAKNPMVI